MMNSDSVDSPRSITGADVMEGSILELPTFAPTFVSHREEQDKDEESQEDRRASFVAENHASAFAAALAASAAATTAIADDAMEEIGNPKPSAAAAAACAGHGRTVRARRQSVAFGDSHFPSTGGPVVAGSLKYRILAERHAEEEAMLRRTGVIPQINARTGGALLTSTRGGTPQDEFCYEDNTIMSAKCYDDILGESGEDFDDVHLEHYAKRDFYVNMERREKRIRELHRTAMWSAVIMNAYFVRLLTAKKRRLAALMRLKRWFRNIILVRRARRSAGVRVAHCHAEHRPTREFILREFPFLKLFDILQGEPEPEPEEEEDEKQEQEEEENEHEKSADGKEKTTASTSPRNKTDEQKTKQQPLRLTVDDLLLPGVREEKEEKERREAEEARQAEALAAFGVQPPQPIPTDVDVVLKPPFSNKLPRGCRTYSEALADGLLRRMLYVTGNHLTNLAQRDRPVSEWFLLHEGRIAEIEDPDSTAPDDGPVLERMAKRMHGRGAHFGWLLPLPLPTPQGQLLLLGTTTRLWRITQDDMMDAVHSFFDTESDSATAATVKAVIARATHEATADNMRRDYPVAPETLRREVPMLSNVSDFALETFCKEVLRNPKTQAGPLWLRQGAQLAHAGSLHNDVIMPCGFGSLLLRRRVEAGAPASAAPLVESNNNTISPNRRGAAAGNSGRSVTIRACAGVRAAFHVPVFDEQVVELSATQRMLVGADELVLPRPSDCDVFVRSGWLAAWRFDKGLFQRLMLHDPTEFVERQRGIVVDRVLRQMLPPLPSISVVIRAKAPALRHVSADTFQNHLVPLFQPRLLQSENDIVTRYPTLVDGLYIVAHGQVRRRRYGGKLKMGSEEHQQILREGGKLFDPTAAAAAAAAASSSTVPSSRSASPFEDEIVAPKQARQQQHQPLGNNFIITYDCDAKDPSTWVAIGGGWEAVMEFLPDPPQRKGTAPLQPHEKWAAAWDSRWSVGGKGFVLMWYIPCSDIPAAFRDMPLELKKKSVEQAVAARAAAMKIHPQVVSRITVSESARRVPSFNESTSSLDLGASANNLLLEQSSRSVSMQRHGSSSSRGRSLQRANSSMRSFRRTMSGAGPLLQSQGNATDDAKPLPGFQILTVEQQQQFKMVGGLSPGIGGSASGLGSATLSKINLLLSGSPTSARSRSSGAGGGGATAEADHHHHQQQQQLMRCGDDPLAAPSYYSPSSAEFRRKPVAPPPRAQRSKTAARLFRKLAKMGIDGDERKDYHPKRTQQDHQRCASSSSSSSGDENEATERELGVTFVASSGDFVPNQKMPNIVESVLAVKPLTRREKRHHVPLHRAPTPPARPSTPPWLSSRGTTIISSSVAIAESSSRCSSSGTIRGQKEETNDEEVVILSQDAIFSKKQQQRRELGIMRYDRDLLTDPDTMYLGHALPAAEAGAKAAAEAVKEHEDAAVFKKLVASAYNKTDGNSPCEYDNRDPMHAVRAEQREQRHQRKLQRRAQDNDAGGGGGGDAQPTAAAAGAAVSRRTLHIGAGTNRQDEVVLTQKDEPVANKLETLLRSAHEQRVAEAAPLRPTEANKELRHAVANVVVSLSNGTASARDARTLPFSKPHPPPAAAAAAAAAASSARRPTLPSSSSSARSQSQKRVLELQRCSVTAAAGENILPDPRTRCPSSSSAVSSTALVVPSSAPTPVASSAAFSNATSGRDLAHSVTFRGEKVVHEQQPGEKAADWGVLGSAKSAAEAAAAAAASSGSSKSQQFISSIQAIQQQQKQLQNMSLFERENNPRMKYSRPVVGEMASNRDFARFEHCLLTMKKKKKSSSSKSDKNDKKKKGERANSSRTSSPNPPSGR